MKATVVWKYLAAVVCFLIFSTELLRSTHFSPLMVETEREKKTTKIANTQKYFSFFDSQSKKYI